MSGKFLPAALTALTTVLLCAGVSAQSQPPAAVDTPYLETVWTTEDGLPQNSVNAIVQSQDG
jgi:hypothetical protein